MVQSFGVDDATGRPPQALEDVAPKPSRSRLLVGVASAAAVVVLVGSLFLITRAGSDKGGAGSPEDAAAELFRAMENEDIVALAELLHPGERRTLAEPMFDVVDELIRLEVIDPSIDLASLDGIDIAFEGLDYRVEPVDGADDLREILVDAGTMSFTADGAALPLGPTIRDRFGAEIDEIDDTDSESMETTSDGPVLVRVDGQWYLSLWYTVAEVARGESGNEPVPTLSEMPAAIGAASPEEAVGAMIAAVTDLDLTSSIGMIDPEEGAALYRYSPLFLDEANEAMDELLAEVDASDVAWDVTNLEYDTSVDGDQALVRITAFDVDVQAAGVSVAIEYSENELSVEADLDGVAYSGTLMIADNVVSLDASFDGMTVQGEIVFGEDAVEGWVEADGERYEGSLTFDPDGTCSSLSFTGEGESEQGCLEEFLPGAQAEMVAGMLSDVSDLKLPTPTIVASEYGGDWYVSPLLTMSNVLLDFLRGTDAETIANQIDQAQNFFGVAADY